MHKSTSLWKIAELRTRVSSIDFPEYQREPTIWLRSSKQRLIDSMVREFDIASIYLYDNGDGTWDCVDGRQRIAAIMSFLGDNPEDEKDQGFAYRVLNEIFEDESRHPYRALSGSSFEEIESLSKTGDQHAKAFVASVLGYELTVVELSDTTLPEEFNLQFTRLNLGAIINSGEKLNAMVGELRDRCFDELACHPFLARISIPTRRFAREQLAAQIVAQVVAMESERAATGHRDFTRVRHVDLQRLFKVHAHLSEDTSNWIARLRDVMDLLADSSVELPVLRSRSIVLSVVLLAYERCKNLQDTQKIAAFVKEFVSRLRWQMADMAQGRGVEQGYRYLLDFQRHLTQASVEKPGIRARAHRLETDYDYWLANGGELRGDDLYRASHDGRHPKTLGV